MGDDLFITRSEGAATAEPRPITPEELYAAAAADPDLRVLTDTFTDEPGDDGRVHRLHPVVTTGDLGTDGYLWPTLQGEVTARSPNDVTVRKMVELAAHLEGRVLGRDGEVYALEDGRVTVDGVPYVGEASTGVPPQDEPTAQVVPSHMEPGDQAAHPYLAPAWHRIGWVLLAIVAAVVLMAWLT